MHGLLEQLITDSICNGLIIRVHVVIAPAFLVFNRGVIYPGINVDIAGTGIIKPPDIVLFLEGATFFRSGITDITRIGVTLAAVATITRLRRSLRTRIVICGTAVVTVVVVPVSELVELLSSHAVKPKAITKAHAPTRNLDFIKSTY